MISKNISFGTLDVDTKNGKIYLNCPSCIIRIQDIIFDQIQDKFSMIDINGNIIPCNLYYGNPEFTYGNLNENIFSEIWQGEKRKEILQKIREKGVKECRIGCRLDAINRYLYRIKNPHPHDNFI